VSCYVDTSALAKWYVAEEGSGEFEAFMLSLPRGEAFISSLTIPEMRSLLARRVRMGDFDSEYEKDAWRIFLRDIEDGALTIISLDSRHYTKAAELIARFSDNALRALDALHLSVALSCGADELASSDKVMLQVAQRLGMRTRSF